MSEVERLRRWKSEATEVILGLQDLGRALGVPLGARITGRSALEAAERLTDRAEIAEAKVARVELLAKEWESWHGKASPLDPADDVRRALKA